MPFYNLNTDKRGITSSNVAGKIRDIYFASQLASRTEIQTFHPPVVRKGSNGASEVSIDFRKDMSLARYSNMLS